MYLITVCGNLLIILAVTTDSHLHTPMYFFLANLSFVDICFTSTTIPKMLQNIQNNSEVITYAGCITQIYFVLLFAGWDDFLLTVMAYDRFVAICHPLHYTVIMNPRLCGLLVLVCLIIIVSLFYCTALRVYLSSASPQRSHSSAVASVMYTVVTPMLNPFIYSPRFFPSACATLDVKACSLSVCSKSQFWLESDASLRAASDEDRAFSPIICSPGRNSDFHRTPSSQTPQPGESNTPTDC
ncbi:olfactory receptor 7A10-like [Enhydra lutris kenyoni]|uniref:Olfactory receptor 7A10-like n=1 Tax=Enhydra lutris kenyoni TaxID=391180 RepID=A0A2Y9J1V2_ENHLU|nr:olfactory receptor 7A10-like [Enhydra lutris kenyoni]